eukprot:2509299-Alexandrium_andersonii.AAC.1
MARSTTSRRRPPPGQRRRGDGRVGQVSCDRPGRSPYAGAQVDRGNLGRPRPRLGRPRAERVQ